MKKEKCIKLLLIIFLFVFIFQHLSNLIVFFFTVYFHINVLILSTNVLFFLMALLCLHKIDNDEQNMSKLRKIQQKKNSFNFLLISGWANV